MRLLTVWVCLMTFSLLWIEGAVADPPDSAKEEERKAQEDRDDDVTGEGTIQDDAEAEEERVEKLFAFYTSTSITRLSTRTITAISTCLSLPAAPMPTCSGRRKRRANENVIIIRDDNIESSLDSSQNVVNLNPAIAEEILEDERRDGRKLTIWSTGFTTVTITSTSILTGTTATASLQCVYPGVAASCYLG